MRLRLLCLYFWQCLFLSNILSAQTNPNQPNILLIIADDLGVDAFNGYQNNQLKPVTPHLDSLRQSGVTFRNAWTAPQCTPTRATMMSGKYGIKTGVTGVPGNLDIEHSSIFKALKESSNDAYNTAVVGKWHISDPADINHPAELGVDYYEGIFGSAVSNNYEDWEKTIGGLDHTAMVTQETAYATSYLTDRSIDWINQQTQSWFLWLAHVAPHAPFHIPPDPQTYSQSPLNNSAQQYMAMIENLDFEIGRLLDGIPDLVLENTTIIFIGDHGAGDGVSQNYPTGHNKGSLYQGSIHAPLFACGKNVTRQNVWEESLVQSSDIYATILEASGSDLAGGVYNSFSFYPLLQNANSDSRIYNYTEIKSGVHSESGYTIRSSQYKYIHFDDGIKELYDLLSDSLELINLYGSNDPTLADVIYDLEREANQIRSDWSCSDLIQNGDEVGIDCGTPACGQCVNMQTIFYCNEDLLETCSDIHIDTFIVAENQVIAAHEISAQNALIQAAQCINLEPGFNFTGQELDIQIDQCLERGINDLNCTHTNLLNQTNIGCSINPSFTSVYTETASGDVRMIVSNNYPDHKHDAKNMASIPVPKDYTFQVDLTPAAAGSSTSILSPTNRPLYFFGVALNGVLLAPAPSTPFIFEDINTGEYNFDWIFEPTNNFGSGGAWVALDCASAHTGPQGYHYHGNMFEYLENIQSGISTTTTPPSGPIHIGWAADGFPVFYRFGPDGVGGLKLLTPSYRLKYGNRPGDGITAPCGSYNGKYTNDYEFVDCLGDLDQCNGIARNITINTDQGIETFDYFYVVTDQFPQISRCFMGTPDPSFR